MEILNAISNQELEIEETKFSRFNIFYNGKLIGQDYISTSGKWMHKWMTKDGSFERGGWRGRAEGIGQCEWIYKPVTELLD